jgi:hypothetical protein
LFDGLFLIPCQPQRLQMYSLFTSSSLRTSRR